MADLRLPLPAIHYGEVGLKVGQCYTIYLSYGECGPVWYICASAAPTVSLSRMLYTQPHLLCSCCTCLVASRFKPIPHAFALYGQQRLPMDV